MGGMLLSPCGRLVLVALCLTWTCGIRVVAQASTLSLWPQRLRTQQSLQCCRSPTHREFGLFPIQRASSLSTASLRRPAIARKPHDRFSAGLTFRMAASGARAERLGHRRQPGSRRQAGRRRGRGVLDQHCPAACSVRRSLGFPAEVDWRLVWAARATPRPRLYLRHQRDRRTTRGLPVAGCRTPSGSGAAMIIC